MHRRGVSYDVGSVMGGNWRPDYDPRVVRRELEKADEAWHRRHAPGARGTEPRTGDEKGRRGKP